MHDDEIDDFVAKVSSTASKADDKWSILSFQATETQKLIQGLLDGKLDVNSPIFNDLDPVNKTIHKVCALQRL